MEKTVQEVTPEIEGRECSTAKLKTAWENVDDLIEQFDSSPYPPWYILRNPMTLLPFPLGKLKLMDGGGERRLRLTISIRERVQEGICQALQRFYDQYEERMWRSLRILIFCTMSLILREGSKRICRVIEGV